MNDDDTNIDPKRLEAVRAMLTAGGFEVVEDDDDYQIWSMEQNDGIFIDLKLTVIE